MPAADAQDAAENGRVGAIVHVRRPLTVQLKPIRDEPAHLRIEADVLDIADRLAMAGPAVQPRMPPAVGQRAGAVAPGQRGAGSAVGSACCAVTSGASSRGRNMVGAIVVPLMPSRYQSFPCRPAETGAGSGSRDARMARRREPAGHGHGHADGVRRGGSVIGRSTLPRLIGVNRD
jgi:hypothetical protein